MRNKERSVAGILLGRPLCPLALELLWILLMLRCHSRTRNGVLWGNVHSIPIRDMPLDLSTADLNLKELMVHSPNCKKFRVAVGH